MGDGSMMLLGSGKDLTLIPAVDIRAGASRYKEVRRYDLRGLEFALLFLIFVLFCLGLFPAFIAHRKNRPFVFWWLYGTLLFLIALPHALLLNSNTSAIGERIRPGEKICPYCYESVPEEVDVCPSCHLRLYDPALHGPPIGD